MPVTPLIISKVSLSPFALPTYDWASSLTLLMDVFRRPNATMVSLNSFVLFLPSAVICVRSIVRLLTASLIDENSLVASPTFISNFGVFESEALKLSTSCFAFLSFESTSSMSFLMVLYSSEPTSTPFNAL